MKRGVQAIILGHLSGENNFPELAYQSVCCVLQEEGGSILGAIIAVIVVVAIILVVIALIPRKKR